MAWPSASLPSMQDGRLLATIGDDNALKLFEVGGVKTTLIPSVENSRHSVS